MDLFGETSLPAVPRPAIRTPRKKANLPPLVASGGLFELNDWISPQRFTAAFHSGASALYDAQGLANAGKDIGVVAGLLRWQTVHLIRTYVQQGGRCFVDTGAFGCFQEWLAGSRSSPVADFETVFQAYDQILSGLPAHSCSNLWLVMPDVVGNPTHSLDLLRVHRDRILALIDRGISAIVPIQKGVVSAGITAQTVFDILGTRNISLGIPSQAAAMAPSDIATIRHDHFHVLGRCSMDMKLYARVYAFLESNPGAKVTCDANRIRSNLPEISEEHHQLIAESEGGHWTGQFDDSELVFDVCNTPNWMSRTQVQALARAYGQTERSVAREWYKAHVEQVGGLKSILDDLDPEATLLSTYAIPAVFGHSAREHQSARLRAVAVKHVFSNNENLTD